MSRNRAPVNGGYVRKTISMPAELFKRIETYLGKTPGLTLSAFMSDAGDEKIKKLPKRRSR